MGGAAPTWKAALLLLLLLLLLLPASLPTSTAAGLSASASSYGEASDTQSVDAVSRNHEGAAEGTEASAPSARSARSRTRMARDGSPLAVERRTVLRTALCSRSDWMSAMIARRSAATSAVRVERSSCRRDQR